jgi:hypothetical protein
MKIRNSLYPLLLIPCFVVVATLVQAQTIGRYLPRPINSTDKFLFYFHGGVVTVLGDNAINQGAPEWGPYQYSAILDSLRGRGFRVISEIRKGGVDDSVYVKNLTMQIDTLTRQSVPMRNILVLGASAGSTIVLLAAAQMKRADFRAVIIGGCWPDAYKDYEQSDIHGRFLSIIERSDPHGTCEAIFRNRKNVVSFQEIALATGLSHGFIYKGHKEWVDPAVNWFRAH